MLHGLNFFFIFLQFNFWQDKDNRIAELEEQVATLKLALKAITLVHTPFEHNVNAPIESRLLDVAKKVRIMQALLEARNRRA